MSSTLSPFPIPEVRCPICDKVGALDPAGFVIYKCVGNRRVRCDGYHLMLHTYLTKWKDEKWQEFEDFIEEGYYEDS